MIAITDIQGDGMTRGPDHLYAEWHQQWAFDVDEWIGDLLEDVATLREAVWTLAQAHPELFE